MRVPLFLISINALFLAWINVSAQTNLQKPNSVLQVDSLGRSHENFSCFAEIYSKSMQNISYQSETISSAGQFFVNKFKTGFARYFIDAVQEYKTGTLKKQSSWKYFFDHLDASYWQKILLGVNAHINGDMWKALTTNFSETEIRQNKKQFLQYQRSVAKVFQPVFDSLLRQSGYMRFSHIITLGLDKKFGERVLYKWRKRSVKLSLLFYRNSKKFNRRLIAVNRKKNRIDTIIYNSKKPSR